MNPVPAPANTARPNATKLQAEACAAAFSACVSRPRTRGNDDRLRRRQLATIWRLRDAYERAASGPLSLDEILIRIIKEFNDARETLFLWVDAVETMIQEVERLYGPAPGQGMYKAAQVKAAVVYMVEAAARRQPPRTLLVSRSGLEVVVDWVIDGVVLLLNRRDLWQLSAQSRLRLAYWFRLRTRLLVVLLDVLGTLQGWILGRTTLLPQVRQIADRTMQQQAADLLARIREAFDFMLWSVDHRRQLVGIVDLVATATTEAEAFLEMSGPEKQRYARELVLLTLQESSDGWPDSPLWNQLVRTLIDFAIDVVVRIFNKRGLFTSRSTAGEPVRAAAA
jgi:hypothetical protein